jgi:DNA-damage-inducible protein D
MVVVWEALMTEDDRVQAQDNASPFERIRRTNASGAEYWSSRDFAQVLGYTDYRNFEQVVKKAKTACFNSGQRIEDHFVDITEMIEIGKGGQRPVGTVCMSRYACYLIVQNADPSKQIVALGQTYFAVQTRRQELTDQATEEDRRLLLREEMKLHNVRLASTAKSAGVVEPKDYAIFQDHGYKGLYGGLTSRDIHERRGLKKSQQILDHMGSTELAANLFRATQTEEKLRRDKVTSKDRANRTHYEVGAKVRKTIQELGGTMPENLPPAESIKKLEARKRNQDEDRGRLSDDSPLADDLK